LLPGALAVPSPADEGQDELTDQGLEAVHFPESCSQTVQEGFDQGVALPHCFVFDTAEGVFLRVLDNDPRCPFRRRPPSAVP